MTGVRRGSLFREAMLSGGAAASLATVLLWLGPPGNDLAAHVYQRTLFLRHGFVLWNNFWYAGRYSFVTYSPLYYPLSAVLGIRVLALASVATAAAVFAVVVGRQWGPAARWSGRTFGIVWAGTVLSAAFPFALGAALALLALWAVQSGHRGRFAALVVLTLAASPLAFVLLAVVLLGIWVATLPPWRRVALPAFVVGGAGLAELLLLRLFPDDGRFPFHPLELVPAAAFCALGAVVGNRGNRPLAGVYVVYLAACGLSFAIPTALGSNIERMRYAAIPLAVLSATLAGWRPLKLALPLLAVAAFWNVTPLVANYRHAAADPAGTPAYWQPAVHYLRAHLTPSYRVEAVDTLEHWPALFLPDAGIPLVRGWYRQNDFPTNDVLYRPFGPASYRRWLRKLGVRFVVLSDAPPDYSSRAEATLLRRGVPGLRLVFRAEHVRVYELVDAMPLITGPGAPSVRRLLPTRLWLNVPAAGDYRLAVRFSPYWRTFQGCVAPARDGMIRLSVFRAGVVDLDFKVNVHRVAAVLAARQPTRFCRA
jgi:hypothetical protein